MEAGLERQLESCLLERWLREEMIVECELEGKREQETRRIK